MTMSRDEIIAYVDRLYEVCGAGDWAAVEDMLTDDFVAWEADSVPMAGAYRGRGGLRALFEKVMGIVEVAVLDRHALTVGDDCAIALLTMRFADPTLAPAELCELFRFRDGKCCEIKPFYYDPAPFAAAVEARKVVA